MADTSDPRPGPNTSESRNAVKSALLSTEKRAMTAGMIAESVDFSRRTVHSRLKELEAAGEIASGKVGSATAYWIPENPEPVQGGAIPDGGYVQLERRDNRLYGHVGRTRVDGASAKLLRWNLSLILAFSTFGIIAWFAGLLLNRPEFIGLAVISSGVALIGALAEVMLLFGFSWPWRTIGEFVNRFSK